MVSNKIYKYYKGIMYNDIMKSVDDEIVKYFQNNFSSLDCIDNLDDIYILAEKISMNSKYEVYNRLLKIKKWRNQLKILKQIPFIKQRTYEWYNLRKERLTASDLYDAVKEGASFLQLAKKKANVIVDNTNYNMIPALKWGTMFEPMASRCYSQTNNDIVLHDFGLICDDNNEHFGASPDGINDLGVMIEIKCPYSRNIVDNYIPDKYKMQIQGQLAVCSLEECDYIECIFKTFKSQEEYLNSIDKNEKRNHGVIAEFLIDNKEYNYIYSESYCTPSECIEHIKKNIENKNNYKLIYWYLDKMNIQKVHFDEDEWKNIYPKINSFWNKVKEFKNMTPEELAIVTKPKSKKKIQFINDD